MALTTYTNLNADQDASGRTFPNHIKPSSIKVEIHQPTLVTTSNALTIQRQSLGTHRIHLDYTYPPMSADELQPFLAFFTAMRGSALAFKLNAPKELINDATHIADDDVHTSTASYAVGVREVVVNGFDNNLTTAIKGGNMIQFSNHDKIYVVAANGGSHETNGTCRIRFEPCLLTAITSAHTLNTFDEDIPIHVIFANDSIKFDVDSALNYGFKVQFIEQWTG